MIKQQTGGSIIFIASISGHSVNFPQPQVAYNTSKAAVLHIKDSLAAEWARYGIRVNSISPGYMDTILNEGDGLEECRRVWYARNPMGRMGDPSEIVGAGVLLTSLAGRYINGADIVVDGTSNVHLAGTSNSLMCDQPRWRPSFLDVVQAINILNYNESEQNKSMLQLGDTGQSDGYKTAATPPPLNGSTFAPSSTSPASSSPAAPS